MKAKLCDVCLFQNKKITLAKRSTGFKGLGKYKLDTCEEHKDWLNSQGWKTLKRSQESQFVDFILGIQVKVESIYNKMVVENDNKPNKRTE